MMGGGGSVTVTLPPLALPDALLRGARGLHRQHAVAVRRPDGGGQPGPARPARRRHRRADRERGTGVDGEVQQQAAAAAHSFLVVPPQRLYAVGAPVDPAILRRFGIGAAGAAAAAAAGGGGCGQPPTLQRAGTAPSGSLLTAAASSGSGAAAGGASATAAGKRRRGSPGPEALRPATATASAGGSNNNAFAATLESELAAARASEAGLAAALQVRWSMGGSRLCSQ